MSETAVGVYSVAEASGTYRQFLVELTPFTDPSPDGYFWSLQWAWAGATEGDPRTGYMGVQTLGAGLPGKAWFYSAAPGTVGAIRTGGIVENSFDGSPGGWSTRATMNWAPGVPVTMLVRETSVTGISRTYEASVTTLVGGDTFHDISNITVPISWAGMQSPEFRSERYSGADLTTCDVMKYSAVRFLNFACTPMTGPTVEHPTYVSHKGEGSCQAESDFRDI